MISFLLDFFGIAESGHLRRQAVEVTLVSPAVATEVTKYYMFGSQRVAMRKNGVLTYLHGDHLGSTVLETNITGTVTTDEKYLAYGKQRDSGKVSTDHRFTGQKEDASGLQYFNARFYDPVIGMFVSPDTIVPDAGNVFDYNRYMYARGNALRYVDPSGHFSVEQLNYLGLFEEDFEPEIWASLLFLEPNDQIYSGDSLIATVQILGGGDPGEAYTLGLYFEDGNPDTAPIDAATWFTQNKDKKGTLAVGRDFTTWWGNWFYFLSNGGSQQPERIAQSLQIASPTGTWFSNAFGATFANLVGGVMDEMWPGSGFIYNSASGNGAPEGGSVPYDVAFSFTYQVPGLKGIYLMRTFVYRPRIGQADPLYSYSMCTNLVSDLTFSSCAQ